MTEVIEEAIEPTHIQCRQVNTGYIRGSWIISGYAPVTFYYRFAHPTDAGWDEVQAVLDAWTQIASWDQIKPRETIIAFVIAHLNGWNFRDGDVVLPVRANVMEEMPPDMFGRMLAVICDRRSPPASS
jgi:hypothetical protein